MGLFDGLKVVVGAIMDSKESVDIEWELMPKLAELRNKPGVLTPAEKQKINKYLNLKKEVDKLYDPENPVSDVVEKEEPLLDEMNEVLKGLMPSLAKNDKLPADVKELINKYLSAEQNIEDNLEKRVTAVENKKKK